MITLGEPKPRTASAGPELSASRAQQLEKAARWLLGGFGLGLGVAMAAAIGLQVSLLWAVAWFLAWGALVAFSHFLFFLFQSVDLAHEESLRGPLSDEEGRVLREPLLPVYARRGQAIVLALGGLVLLSLLPAGWSPSAGLSSDAAGEVRLAAIGFLVIGFALQFLQRYAGSVQAQLESDGLNGPIYLARLGFWVCAVVAATMFGFLYAGRDCSGWVGRCICVVTALLVIEAGIRAAMAAFQPRVLLANSPPLGGSLVLEALFRRGNPLDSLIHHVESSFGVKVGHGWIVQFLRQTTEPVILVGIVLVWLSTSVTAVPPQSHGVRVRWGHYLSPALEPGLYFTWPWPAEKIEIIPTERIEQITLGFEHDLGGPALWTETHYEGEQNLLVGNGEEMLSISVPIYYRIRDPLAYLKTTTNAQQALTSLAYRQLLAVTEGRDSFRVMTVERQAISRALQQSLQQEVDRMRLGLEIVFVGLKDIHPPVAVAPAYQDVVSAEEEEQAFVHNADAYHFQTMAQAGQQANRLRTGADALFKQRTALAEGESSRFAMLAMADAASTNLFRLRLRLEALEKALSKPQKVVLTRAAGANREFYLDLRNFGGLPPP